MVKKSYYVQKVRCRRKKNILDTREVHKTQSIPPKERAIEKKGWGLKTKKNVKKLRNEFQLCKDGYNRNKALQKREKRFHLHKKR